MPLIRKDQAGSDSLGHTWDDDGAVVDMSHEQAEELLAIPDGGFTLVVPDAGGEPEPGDGDPEPEGDGAAEPDANPEFSEVDPEAPADEPETKPAAKKAAAKRTPRKPVEEG